MSNVSGDSGDIPYSMRYMVGEGGPKYAKNEKPAKPAKESKKVRLNHFEKMISVSLQKKPERILEDGEFIDIVQKGTAEIINALHKTTDPTKIRQYIKQFERCDKKLAQLNTKFDNLLRETPQKDKARKEEIRKVSRVIEAALRSFYEEKDFVEKIQDVAIPAPVVGKIGAFLSKYENREKALDQLLELFSAEGRKGKKAAVKEMQKEAKWTEEVNNKIRNALKTQGEAFTFPEELKGKLTDITSLDFYNIAVSAKAMQEILTHWPHLIRLNLSYNPVTKELLELVGKFKDLRHLDLSMTRMNNAKLQELSTCTNLRTLTLNGSRQITSLQPLTSCTQLHELRLSGCTGIIDLKPLASCTELQQLFLDNCTEIVDLKPLASCTQLRLLVLSNCDGISVDEKAALLKALPNLRVI